MPSLASNDLRKFLLSARDENRPSPFDFRLADTLRATDRAVARGSCGSVHQKKNECCVGLGVNRWQRGLKACRGITFAETLASNPDCAVHYVKPRGEIVDPRQRQRLAASQMRIVDSYVLTDFKRGVTVFGTTEQVPLTSGNGRRPI